MKHDGEENTSYAREGANWNVS